MVSLTDVLAWQLTGLVALGLVLLSAWLRQRH
jgi:hypothetical protein